jgi:hypothetical protein
MKSTVATCAKRANGRPFILAVLFAILGYMRPVQAFFHQFAITQGQGAEPFSGVRCIHICNMLQAGTMCNFPLNDLLPSPSGPHGEFSHTRVEKGKNTEFINQLAISSHMPPQNLEARQQSICDTITGSMVGSRGKGRQSVLGVAFVAAFSHKPQCLHDSPPQGIT